MPSGYPTPDDTERKIIERYRNGESGGGIAEAEGVSSSTVYNVLGRNDVESRDPGETKRALDPHEEKEVIEKYNEGSTLPALAEEYDVALTTIFRVMERHDVERHHGKLTESEEEEMIAQYNDGVSTREIATTFDIDVKSVYNILNKHEVELFHHTFTGPQHWDWNGGGRDYYGRNWHQQRRKAIERDGEECRICGVSRSKHKEEIGIDLAVHHIQPIGAFIEDGGLDCERANDIDNLVTLCNSCHQRWEGIPVIPDE